MTFSIFIVSCDKSLIWTLIICDFVTKKNSFLFSSMNTYYKSSVYLNFDIEFLPIKL